MKIIQFSFFLFVSFFVHSQTIKFSLPLTFHDGNGPFEYENFPIRFDDTSIAYKNTYPDVKGIPQNLKNIKRGIICFDLIQYVYQNFIAGKISKPKFLKNNRYLGGALQ